MRFCEKLANVRRAQNLSQEQFADMLKVSRQSVSKWENGEAYPNMERIIEMSKILNCTLGDLMDDGALGEEVQPKSNKKEWQAYFKDFLSFISKTYNMFVAMPFWQKIKCLFEVAFLAGIMIPIGLLTQFLISSFLLSFFRGIPAIGNDIYSFLYKLVQLILTILFIIIWFYLFKIRYLDYYEIIEDVNIKEKVIEKPITEKPEKKVIIRDPKHASNKFFEGLGAIIMLFCKFFVICFSIPAMIVFASFILVSAIFLCHLSYGSLFLWLAVGFIGLAIISLFFVDLFYHFIFKEKKLLKIPLFLVLIFGIIVSSVSFGVSIATYAGYEKVEFERVTKTVKLEEGDISFIYQNIRIDNSLPYRTIEFSYPKGFNFEVKKVEKYYYFEDNNDFGNFYPLFLNDIKNHKMRIYDENFSPYARMSNKTYKKLIRN